MLKKPIESIKFIYLYSPKGKLIKTFGDIKDLGEFHSSSLGNEISFDRGTGDCLYVSFYYQNRIEKFSPDGKLRWRASRPLNYREGLVEKPSIDRATGEQKAAKFNRCSAGIAVDNKGRAWVLTLNRQIRPEEEVKIQVIAVGSKKTMKVLGGNTSLERTDIYKLEVFSSEGKLIASLPLDHFAQHVRIFNDKIFLLDRERGMKVYHYKILGF